MRITPLIIAHRGASAVAPENTLIAFRRALLDGADGVECDVRLAGDGVPVVIHDATLKRTGLEDIKICHLTSCELGRADVGAWFNFKHRVHSSTDYVGETVPSLAQLFEMVHGEGDKLIYVELKCENGNSAKLARATTNLINDFNLQNRVIVKSFKQECLYEIKRLSSRIQIATLFKPHPMRVLRPGRNLVKPTLRLKAEEISLHYTLATERILRKAHDANLKTVIWTADHPSWLERAFKFGIYGVITNNPARLVAYRNKYLA